MDVVSQATERKLRPPVCVQDTQTCGKQNCLLDGSLCMSSGQDGLMFFVSDNHRSV